MAQMQQAPARQANPFKDAIQKAADDLNSPNADPKKVAEQLLKELVSSLTPGGSPDAKLKEIFTNGVDPATKSALGPAFSIFKLGMDMCFSGVVNQGMTKNFSAELLKFLAPEGMQQFKDLVASAGLGAFRGWKL